MPAVLSKRALSNLTRLLGVDDLEPLLHLAAFVAPALLVRHQGDVGVLWDALLAVAAVHAVPIVLITKVIITAGHRGGVVMNPRRYNMEVGSGSGSVSPLSELQVGRVVDHSGGFPIQSLPLQTKTAQKHKTMLEISGSQLVGRGPKVGHRPVVDGSQTAVQKKPIIPEVHLMLEMSFIERK